MVIYSMQATLFVAAYFSRFEWDLTILAFVPTFFVLSITIMQLAARSGWRLRDASGAAAASALSRILTVLQQPKLLPWYSYLAIVLALAVYAALIVLETDAVSSDIRILILALFAVTIGLLVTLRAAALAVVAIASVYRL